MEERSVCAYSNDPLSGNVLVDLTMLPSKRWLNSTLLNHSPPLVECKQTTPTNPCKLATPMPRLYFFEEQLADLAKGIALLNTTTSTKWVLEDWRQEWNEWFKSDPVPTVWRSNSPQYPFAELYNHLQNYTRLEYPRRTYWSLVTRGSSCIWTNVQQHRAASFILSAPVQCS